MLPTGIILLWYGAIVDIPDGWIICDGANGTPNLQNNFVVGAGDTYAVDATGGAITHTHDFTADPHRHTIGAGVGLAAGAGIADITLTEESVGTTDAEDNLPPYHALAYIMKT